MEYSYIFTIILHNFFFDLKQKIVFENFNISENNIIIVEIGQGTN
jgi:hypothetical protein